MRTQLVSKVKCAESQSSPAFPVEPEILNFAISGYKSVPFEDNTFDIILVSLVLCAVGDQRESVREIKRVLKPGGKLLYLEHTQWPEGTWPRLCVKYLGWMWRFIFECHADRETDCVLEQEFDKVECTETWMPFLFSSMRMVSVHPVPSSVAGRSRLPFQTLA